MYKTKIPKEVKLKMKVRVKVRIAMCIIAKKVDGVWIVHKESIIMQNGSRKPIIPEGDILLEYTTKIENKEIEVH